MKRILFVAILLLTFTTSCKVDFSPNADWKEVPVVWCVLDQYDDTTWVRVQRCYLGSENLYNYTQVSDSIYYPKDSITVTLEKWEATEGADNILTKTGDAPKETKTLEYMLRSKDTGLFAGGVQPLYFAPTYGWLQPNYVYRIVVSHKTTGEVVASAETQLVGQKIDQSNPRARDLVALERPNPSTPAYSQFRFAGNPAKCEIAWKPLVRARLYQPVVRFYYYHLTEPDANGERHNDYTQKYHIDINVPSVSQSGSPNEVTTAIYESSFFADLVDAVRSRGDNAPKGFCDSVDIRLSVCNEDLNAYIKSTEPSNTIVQDRVVYSNINDGNGVGIFAARRTPHLIDNNDGSTTQVFIFTVPTNAETGSGSYHSKLKNLNIGFEAAE
ncbi:MAG: DUF4249 family protein [Bacteroidales bacterium]|nr:DUF4249 family protein [Bacteroidales bacterium]